MSIYRPEDEPDHLPGAEETQEEASKSPLQFPPLTHQRLENCAFSSWYPKFRSVTIKSKTIPLPEEFIHYLNADGIFIPGQSNVTLALTDSEDEGDNIVDIEKVKEETMKRLAQKGDDSDDSSDDEDQEEEEEVSTPHFPLLELEIEQAIEEFGGEVFPKLNWSSPRDASWIMASNTLKCFNAADIFLLLKSSDFIAHDLGHAYEDCSDAVEVTTSEGKRGKQIRKRPETFELILRKWFDLAPSMEFRCFVKDNKLVGISQRDMTYYDFLSGIKDELEDKIIDFYEDKIKDKFPDSDYTFDVYITRNKDRIYVIDFNPFAQKTDALLFEWEELIQAQEQLPLRILASEAASRHMTQPFSFNRYPSDVSDLSNGQTVAEFAEEFYKKVQTASKK